MAAVSNSHKATQLKLDQVRRANEDLQAAVSERGEKLKQLQAEVRERATEVRELEAELKRASALAKSDKRPRPGSRSR